MSRSYNEDWQRRKSYLIRCLSNDIPYRALSPVPEEFTPSPSASALGECDHSLLSENAGSSSQYEHNVRSEPAPSIDDRAYSPLPPLLIEREPNKHDETQEYYDALLTKIRIVYRKMFIEGKHLSDDDFYESDHEHNSTMRQVIASARASSNLSNDSCYSNAYSGDFEWSDEMINDNGNQLTDEENEPSDNVGTHGDVVVEVSSHSSALNEHLREPYYRQVTTRAIVHAEGSPHASQYPSPEYGTQATETLATRAQSIQYTGPIDASRPSSPESPEPQCHIEETSHIAQRHLSEEPVGELALTLSRRQEKQAERRDSAPASVGPVLEDKDTSSEQITSQARSLVREPASPPFQEPAFVLRFRRTGDGLFIGDTDTPVLQNSRNLIRSSSPNETEDRSSHHIEVMRACQPSTARPSFSLDVTRLSSDMELTCEHNTIQDRTISSVTSQNGGQNSTGKQTLDSTDYNILSKILNESSNKTVKLSNTFERSRKRCYEDSSVQTENMSWNDLRANFFVGAPKIMKLCACVHHICK